MSQVHNPIDIIHQELMGQLHDIVRICNAHDIPYNLMCGTLLGAVRHKGFIPWDDDVDVFMLRDDYEKLCRIWDERADTEHYSCVRSNDRFNIRHSATEIKDNNTTFINRHSADLDIHQG